MGMRRLAVLLACLLALLVGGPARAQAPTPPLTPSQTQQALDVLNDPAKRAAMTATLEAILKAQSAATASAGGIAAQQAGGALATTPLGLPLVPDSLGAAVLVGAAGFLNTASDRVAEGFRAARGLPLLWGWLVTMATDPIGHQLMGDLAGRLAVVLALSFAAAWGAARVVRRPLRVVVRGLARLPPLLGLAEPKESGEARAEGGEIEPPVHRRVDLERLARRVPLVLARVALGLVPVLVFLIVGHVVVGSTLGGTELLRLVLLAMVDSIGLCAAVLRLVRGLLAPRHRRLRLLPVSNAAAIYAMRWIRRLLVVGVIGYATAEVGLLLGLSQVAHLAVLKAVVLVEHIFLCIIVVQKRRVVRRWIHAPPEAAGLLARLRNRLAAIWHWLALFYLVSAWVVWVTAVPAGYEHLTRVLVAFVVVVLLVRLVAATAVGGLERFKRHAPNLVDRYPGLDVRLSQYHPFLVGIIRVLVLVLAVPLFLELMGVGSFQWLAANPLGARIIDSLVTLAITLLLALAVWEGANAAIERHMARLTREAQIARSARLRTLLPILRATLLIAVLTVTGLVVLSEIGVNTAPLLASAGIIGVAIGFGSQKLVQDLITGLFLLLENAMQVGDTVTVSGLSGTVEHLSMRTIRLRAADGSVHIIPFSAVTSVTNTNRGLGNAAVSVTVAYHEDTDLVCEALQTIADEMREAADFSPVMLSDLQVWGVDRLDGASVTITGQITCTDAGRWRVQREFNRRVKKRFAALGIELFDPTRTLVMSAEAGNRPTAEAPAIPET